MSLSAFRSQLKEWTTTVMDFLNEQTWFQELKTKWEELDPQSKTNLKLASVVGGIVAVFILVFSSMWGVHQLKKEVLEKRALLGMIQSANDEIRRLQEAAPGLSASPASSANPASGDSAAASGGWNTYFESLVSTAGLDKSSLTISADKPGTASDQAKEVLFDLDLKHVNIRQIVKFAYSLENGQRPVKLRNLTIHTKDAEGYLDANLAISAFSMVKHE